MCSRDAARTGQVANRGHPLTVHANAGVRQPPIAVNVAAVIEAEWLGSEVRSRGGNPTDTEQPEGQSAGGSRSERGHLAPLAVDNDQLDQRTRPDRGKERVSFRRLLPHAGTHVPDVHLASPRRCSARWAARSSSSASASPTTSTSTSFGGRPGSPL